MYLIHGKNKTANELFNSPPLQNIWQNAYLKKKLLMYACIYSPAESSKPQSKERFLSFQSCYMQDRPWIAESVTFWVKKDYDFAVVAQILYLG